MQRKYVVKNCPCNVTTEDMCDWENTNETYCEDCTDCLIIQVIEKCKEAIKTYDNEEFYEDDCDRFLGVRQLAIGPQCLNSDKQNSFRGSSRGGILGSCCILISQ